MTRISLPSLLIGQIVCAVLLFINVALWRSSPVVIGERVIDYSLGWPVPFRQKPFHPTDGLDRDSGFEFSVNYKAWQINGLVNLAVLTSIVVLCESLVRSRRRTSASLTIPVPQAPLATVLQPSSRPGDETSKTA